MGHEASWRSGIYRPRNIRCSTPCRCARRAKEPCLAVSPCMRDTSSLSRAKKKGKKEEKSRACRFVHPQSRLPIYEFRSPSLSPTASSHPAVPLITLPGVSLPQQCRLQPRSQWRSLKSTAHSLARSVVIVLYNRPPLPPPTSPSSPSAIIFRTTRQHDSNPPAAGGQSTTVGLLLSQR